MSDTMSSAGLLFMSVRTTSSKVPAMANPHGDWEALLKKFRQALQHDPTGGRNKLCDVHGLLDFFEGLRDEEKKARPFKEFDFAKAEEEKEAKIAERLATPGMGEVPWCRDGDDEFRQEMEEKENKTQATTAWLPIIKVPMDTSEACGVTEDPVVKEGRALSMVARDWSLGTTSWDGPPDKVKEWVPCTPAAREEHLASRRRKRARVAAYEAKAGFVDSVRALRPPTNTATAGLLLAGSLNKKDLRNKEAEETLKALRKEGKAEKAAKNAARHDINRQRREAGINTRRPVMEEEDAHEDEDIHTLSNNAPQDCRTRTRQADNTKRWGHDGFEAMRGERTSWSKSSAGVDDSG